MWRGIVSCGGEGKGSQGFRQRQWRAQSELLLLRVLHKRVEWHELHEILFSERVADNGILAPLRHASDTSLLIDSPLEKLHLTEETVPRKLLLGYLHLNCATVDEVKTTVGR